MARGASSPSLEDGLPGEHLWRRVDQAVQKVSWPGGWRKPGRQPRKGLWLLGANTVESFPAHLVEIWTERHPVHGVNAVLLWQSCGTGGVAVCGSKDVVWLQKVSQH